MTDSLTIGAGGLTVEILRRGATIRSIRLAGVDHSLVVGVRDLQHYEDGNRGYFGASVGRFANRIGEGRLDVAGKAHALARNDPPHHLHGGPTGFSTRLWTLAETAADRALLRYTSADGEENYPGTLEATAEFSIAADGTLTIAYGATTTAETVVNLTSHLYFNLDGGGDVRGHRLLVHADRYLPTEAANLPTGTIAAVEGTAFDFRRPKSLSEAPDYLDHNFCLTPRKTGVLRQAARLMGAGSGVTLDLHTSEPGLQVYDGHKLDGSAVDLTGNAIASRSAVALEPQLWPDAPNRPDFPSAELLPGDTYRHVSTYRFTYS